MPFSSIPTLNRRMKRLYGWYTFGFAVFVFALSVGENMGLTPKVIGYLFLFATLAVYSTIGVLSRTADVNEYYVAGRRVPAFFNGMATAGDWLSAASFIGMAGTLYFGGYQGLAFVMGWTGGYVLVALLLAPYLRKFGQFTIPDFLGARYGGNVARFVGVVAAILASFTYVVAQIYGVGLIMTRFLGIEFEIGVFVGLAGILVCSFLGGMRAVTWTQVAQYIILIVAYLTPVVMMSQKLTGVPVPQLTFGSVLERLGTVEKKLVDDPGEKAVRAIYRVQADELAGRLKRLPESLEEERRKLSQRLEVLRTSNAPIRDFHAAQRSLRDLPKNEADARAKWEAERRLLLDKAEPPRPHAEPFGGDPAQRDISRRNFMALVICLMVGTAALPHILMRYYTTPSVREARESVFWSLFFIFLLYVTAPAYAVFVKWIVYHDLVGSNLAHLPAWIGSWGRVGMVRIDDVNGDGILQLAELTMNSDVIVLATPEIAGLPYVVAGLVAAGGLAAALSTADGLLLTIANALSHDIYYKMLSPDASAQRRLVMTKGLLLVVAMVAAWVASLRPDGILFVVGLAFSIAASAFFPALVLGIFWKRANTAGAIAGMIGGLGLTLYYAVVTHPFFGGSPAAEWFSIQPIASGIFGLPLGFALIVVVSLLTQPPSQEVQDLVENVRYPYLERDDN